MFIMSIPCIKDCDYSFKSGLLTMSIKKEEEWEGKETLARALTIRIVKYAIVVDDDVDIHNRKELELALPGRVQPDKYLVVMKAPAGSMLDPSCKKGSVTDKIGIDATMPLTGDEALPDA